MRIGWTRPDRWRQIDGVIDYFGDAPDTRAVTTRRRSHRPSTRGSAIASRVYQARLFDGTRMVTRVASS
jgi:hypothetical protein